MPERRVKVRIACVTTYISSWRFTVPWTQCSLCMEKEKFAAAQEAEAEMNMGFEQKYGYSKICVNASRDEK